MSDLWQFQQMSSVSEAGGTKETKNESASISI